MFLFFHAIAFAIFVFIFYLFFYLDVWYFHIRLNCLLNHNCRSGDLFNTQFHLDLKHEPEFNMQCRQSYRSEHFTRVFSESSETRLGVISIALMELSIRRQFVNSCAQRGSFHSNKCCFPSQMHVL